MQFADPFFEASINRMIAGRQAKIFPVIGRRTTFVGSVQNDIGELLTAAAAFTILTGAESLEVVGGAGDNAAGAGVKSVNITYIDTDGNMQTQSVALNQATPVALPFGAKHIQLMEVDELGAANSTGTATNNIDLRVAGGGTIHERITAGGNRSLSAKFMIPLGWSGFIRARDVHAINQDMDTRLRATVKTHDRSLCANNVFRFQDIAYIAINTNSDQDDHWLSFPPLSRIKVSAIPGATTGSPRADTSFGLLLVKES